MLIGCAVSRTMTLPASLPTSERVTAPTPGVTRGWSFEDVRPGEVIRHPIGRTVGDAEHVWLAWATHNVSDVHGNADAAARGEWGRPLVLGMLTAAIVIGLAEPAPGPPERVARSLGQGWDSIALERPVLPGATIFAESHIEAVETDPDGLVVLVRRTIVGRDQTGAVVVRVGETRNLPRID